MDSPRGVFKIYYNVGKSAQMGFSEGEIIRDIEESIGFLYGVYLANSDFRGNLLPPLHESGRLNVPRLIEEMLSMDLDNLRILVDYTGELSASASERVKLSELVFDLLSTSPS